MKRFALVLTVLFSLFFVSCSDKVMGYSVLLWNAPQYSLASGDTVPVYIKSNISHVYVIGTASGEKVELPLWQLTEPVKKSKTSSVLQKYSENAHTYASVKLDGLPCRAEPVNTAKQVYRLRKGEIIKILYKGKGQAVMAGKNPLEGDWYRILTDNGTEGWCFSYNLILYETDAEGNKLGIVEEAVEEEADEIIQHVLETVWYPDSYQTMINSGNIDLSKISPSYNFRIDTENNKVSLNTYEIHQLWDYTGYTKNDDYEYELNDIPITIYYKNQHFIVLRYTGETGKPEELNFVKIDQDLNELITAEKDRRNQAYLKIYETGPKFASTSYGTIVFAEDASFRWNGFKLLVPSVIRAGTKNAGIASVKYSVSKVLQSNYDGVLTLKFDGMNEEVNFLYKIEADGIRFEDATSATFKGNQVISRGASPLILYFKRSN